MHFIKKNIQNDCLKSDKQIAILLLFLTFFLHTIYAIYFYYFQSPPKTHLYYELAQEVIKQGRFIYDTSDSYSNVVGPVIIWINALTMLVFGKNYLGLYIVTSLGTALVTFFTYKTARLFLDKRTSLFAGVWSMMYLFYFYYTPDPGKDIWMAFFMIYLIYLLIKLFVKQIFTYRKFLLFILMFVISLHLDERYIIFCPFIVIFILFNNGPFFSLKNFKIATSFVVLTILLMLPWAIRNYYKYDKIVILTTRTERFTDKLFGYEPNEYFSDDFTSIKGLYYIPNYQLDSVITGLKTVTDAGYKIPIVQIEAMKNGQLPKPLTGVNAFASRIKTMFEPFQIKGNFEQTGYYYYKKSVKQNIATFLYYGIIFLFSFPGFYFLYKKNKPVFFLFSSTIIIYALLHALTIPYTNWRYRLPLDAIFIITGCLGMSEIYKKLNNKFF